MYTRSMEERFFDESRRAKEQDARKAGEDRPIEMHQDEATGVWRRQSDVAVTATNKDTTHVPVMNSEALARRYNQANALDKKGTQIDIEV